MATEILPLPCSKYQMFSTVCKGSTIIFVYCCFFFFSTYQEIKLFHVFPEFSLGLIFWIGPVMTHFTRGVQIHEVHSSLGHAEQGPCPELCPLPLASGKFRYAPVPALNLMFLPQHPECWDLALGIKSPSKG